MAKIVLNVKVDKETKEQARALAAEIGVPLSTIVNANLKEFVRKGEVTFSREPELKPEVWKRIQKASKDAREGKNISGPFDNVEDLISHLGI